MNNVAIVNSTEIYLEEVEEIDSIPEIQVVVNILDAPISAFRDLMNSEEPSLLHITRI